VEGEGREERKRGGGERAEKKNVHLEYSLFLSLSSDAVLKKKLHTVEQRAVES
jgi:hypothetical protein